MSDTIFALATAKGRAGVSVIRISGPDAFTAAAKICGSDIPARSPVVRNLKDADNQTIDEALVLGFKGPASFTGEDVIELQCHGSVAVVASVLKTLSSYENCRLAEAGEFTRRALTNNRLDLSQVEGLGDLIEAETEAQQKQALLVMQGGLSNKVEDWRKDLIRAVALIEATIDFADEDIPQDVSPEVSELLNGVLEDLQQQIDGSFAAERIREGFEVAIVGPPNAGKSTLLNTLAGRDAAITSEVAGTTRDVIEVRMDLGGLPVTLLDTAGLRETNDTVESIGIDRAIDRAQRADIRVFLNEDVGDPTFGLTPAENDLRVWSKSDLMGQRDGLNISSLTGDGIDTLVREVSGILEKKSSNAMAATHERHRVALLQASEYIFEGKSIISKGYEFSELAAAEIHQGIYALNSLIGRVDVEHILDEIFSSFCLGK
ncbi:tRNA uridine-5-carboxymethylaminomethyl(34) synthesis GTPase MnmE [Amylibacter sp. SFDW26]|uniref:tRNA uridine-5-carboxymethylaminomethyl(34) synthesis GTPase MnmE n=1 Tax=Amylibacter sp. SFDW26 TaxID=2652722 RepID=UPI0012620DA1|nr:tRNA uridine-5-carboxymethylaminomethyl(34) synthesis GTPase MnmE [Amylibacter sp. SFDW26]KAB7614565.1 tRNA uridine-5-carboxymethylaminomethyl(34) synthesis GTPase MnmE [Amylibacter sp. SFDW26]